MAKKHVSSTDLTWMIFQQMRDETNSKFAYSLAVVPDGKSSWSVVVAKGQAMSIGLMQQLAAVEKSLQAKYALQPD